MSVIYYKTLYDTPESFEFWINISKIRAISEDLILPTGKILLSATGSVNTVHTIRKCGFSHEVVAFNNDSDVAFSALESDLFDRVIVDSSENLTKDFKSGVCLLGLEYSEETPLNEILTDSSHLTSHVLKDCGLLYLKLQGNQLKIQDSRHAKTHLYIKQNLIKSKTEADLNLKEYFASYLKAFAKAKIPELSLDKIEKSLDVFSQIEQTGIYDSLKSQLQHFDLDMLNCIIEGFTLFTILQEQLVKKNKILNPCGMVFNLSQNLPSIRVYGTVHRLQKKKYFLDKIYSMPPLLPNFVFVDTCKFEEAFKPITSLPPEEIEIETKEFIEKTIVSIKRHSKA